MLKYRRARSWHRIARRICTHARMGGNSKGMARLPSRTAWPPVWLSEIPTRESSRRADDARSRTGCRGGTPNKSAQPCLAASPMYDEPGQSSSETTTSKRFLPLSFPHKAMFLWSPQMRSGFAPCILSKESAERPLNNGVGCSSLVVPLYRSMSS
jgi:hypothetical protein